MSWLEDPGVAEFASLDLTKLKIDEAYVLPATTLTNMSLYSAKDNCYKCCFEMIQTQWNYSVPWIVNTEQAVSWRILQNSTHHFISSINKSGVLCEMRPELGEFGVYTLNVAASGCQLTTDKPPVNIYLPLLMAVLVLGGACATYFMLSLLSSRARRTHKLSGNEGGTNRKRKRSIDTFRGLVIVVMVFVNSDAGFYGLLTHTPWNGLHLADVVAPGFVWLMGVCIPLSFKGMLARNSSKATAFLNILKRSCTLFALGVLFNLMWPNDNIRVMGVLQRLGVSYLVAATCYLFTASSAVTRAKTRGRALIHGLRDVRAVAWCWALAAALVFVHSYVTFCVHDPDCPRGYLGPGGLHNDREAPAKCVGGAAGYLDRLLLTERHTKHYGHHVSLYKTEYFESDSILSLLTSSAHVLVGVQAGATLLHYERHVERLVRWAMWVPLLMVPGAVLAGFSIEGGLVPVNLTLWSSSLVLMLSGASTLLLAVCYVLTDAWCMWSGAPFHAVGRNAILLYFAHSTFSTYPIRWRHLPGLRTHAAHLLEALWTTAFWTGIAQVLAHYNIFLKV